MCFFSDYDCNCPNKATRFYLSNGAFCYVVGTVEIRMIGARAFIAACDTHANQSPISGTGTPVI